jgi:hypothetical protein
MNQPPLSQPCNPPGPCLPASPTRDVAGRLAQVDGLEGRAPPEAVQLLGQPKGDAQVVQALRGAVCQVDQQGGQP